MSTKRIADIAELAARISGVSRAQLFSRSRKQSVVVVRNAVCMLARDAGHSFLVISRAFNRDHTTVIHGVRMCGEWAKSDADYADFLWQLREDVAAAVPFLDEGEKPPIALPKGKRVKPVVPFRPAKAVVMQFSDMDHGEKNTALNMIAGSRKLATKINLERGAVMVAVA